MEPTSIALTQISILVTNLNKKNQSQSVASIKQIIEEFGLEVERHYLRCLFTTINTSDLQSSQQHLNLLITEIKNQITKPYFSTNICYCFESFTNNNQNQKTLKTVLSNLLPEICKNLSTAEKVNEIVFLIALTNCYFAPEVQKYSEEQLKQVAPKFFESYLRNEIYRYQDTTLVDLLPDTLQILLQNFDKFGINTYLKQEILLKLQSDFPIEQTPLILVPLIYPTTNPQSIDVYENLETNQIMETSWSNLLKEIGYEFTASVDECKNHLKCGGNELQPADIAKIISFMCKTHSSLNDGNANNLPTPGTVWSAKNASSNNNSESSSEKPESGTEQQQQSTENKQPEESGNTDSTVANSGSGGNNSPTWKPEVFVQAVKEILPNIVWKDVCVQLDNKEFFIRDRQGLNLLLTVFRLGTGSNLFPTELIYRHWQNVIGQLSLITIILKNPDLFSFADYIFTPAPVEVLKTPPENENKEIATWKSLHLVDALLYIADHQPQTQQCYRQVHEIFSFPVKQCPDVLFMALLQISPPLTSLRIELFKTLIPIFLGSHSNSGIILQHAWNCTLLPALQQLIMNSMSDCYLRSDCDQTKLSRILDVAQDLKALSSLLNARSFMFVIDLACLASRREYLKLEKWLSDKIREHGEQFVQAIVKFLQRRCPQIMGKNDDQQLMIPKSVQLPLETVTTMVACLQSCANNVQQELCDLIMQMSNYCNILTKQARQQPPPTGVPPLTATTTTPGPAASNLNLMRQQPGPPGPGQHHQNPSGPPFNPQIFGNVGLGGAGLGGAGLGGALGGMGVNVDLAHINSNMAGLNLNGPNGAFNFNNVLNTLVSTPSSPSRMMNANANSNSPFPMMMQQHQQQQQQQQQHPQHQQAQHSGVPRLPATPNPAGGHENVLPELNQQVSKEVEDEANSYFQRIYNHPPHPTLSIDEVLDMLQRFKEYQGCREQEVYHCMIRNLFEEYRFFPQYPEKELLITAQLFGGIIERNLVPTFLALGLALRCVLDALRKPEGYKMYYFGIVALDRFKSRLSSYSKYCEFVKTIPHFHEFPQHLIQYVEYGSIGQEPPNKPQGPVLPPAMAPLLPPASGATPNVQQSPSVESLYRSSSAAAQLQQQQQQKPQPIQQQQSASIASQPISSRAVKSIATATNIDTLLSANTEREEKVTNPPDSVADKTAFIFNNLSQLNLQQKCEEIKEIMTQEYWPWLSQYLVLKRASIELNFHSLYSNFLDAMKNKEVLRLVTRETFRNIRVLLRSEKHVNNFSDRTLLKNLGHWLGMMTLARNRPILAIDIDLKSLLVEAFHKGQQELLFIVPFVAKVLESCSKSKIFKPPNPWTMAIMNVLGELHTEPDLKLNLKFEIEVLCKTLNLDTAKLRPVYYLKDPDRIRSIELQLSQPKPPAKMQEITQADLQMAQALQQHQSFRNMDDSTMVLLNNPSIVSNPSPSISNDSAGASTGVCGQVVNQPPPEPKFSYIDLVINNYNSLSQYLVINPAAIGILANNPALKHTLTTAIERTITEWLQPLVDRSVRIAVQTTEQIVRKDFALDHDENRMRIAAHHMVRNLASGMAMITCKDQLIQALTTNLRKAFVQNAQSYVGFQDSIEAACNQLAQDNHELVCAFMQKTAGEKALPEIDRRIAHDFEVRKTAREEGRRYCEAESLTYQAERMPEQVRLKMGAASNQQFAVYTEFARTIPGFIPMNERDINLLMPKNTIQENYTTQQNFGNVGGNTSAGNNTADEMSLVYSDLASKIEAFITNAQQFSTLQLQLSKMHALLKALVNYHRVRDNDSGFILVTRVVEALIEGLTNNISADQIDQMKLYRNICLRTLTMFQSTFGASITERVVTKCVLEIREDVRYNLEAMKLLISSRFINMQHFDNSLIALMESGNYLAITFSMQIVQHFLIDERGNTQITEQDFCNTIEMLARLAQVHRGPEGLGNLIEHLRINHDPNMFSSDRMGPTQFIHSGMNSVRQADCDDPPDLHDKTVFLLKDWCTVYSTMNGTRDTVKNFSIFIQKMNLYGILKTDDLITRFFRQATQFCIDIVYMNPEQNPANHRQMIFKWMDAYVKLIILLFRHSGEASNPATKINLLNKVLGIVVGVLLQDQEVRGVNFQQIGYQRFFTMLFIELSSSDPVIESVMLSVVTAFSHAYHFLNPSCAPGFAYAWLELVSHRVFLSRILAQIPQQKGWPLYCQLLLDLFKYLAPFLRNTELAKPVQILYKGTLRVLLVLLHDFPEFLCDYHFAFCDVIPSNCIQMRNIILAAFPRNMRLPDPFTPNLKAHMLLETGQAPKIFSNYVSNIEANFKKNLDSYLKARSPVTFLSEIRTHLQSSKEPGSVYNIPLINALVLYVGTQAIAHISTKNQVPNASNIASSAHIDIFQNLAVDLDHEGRYLFLNAIANQLRYPNSHTQYFSCVVLHLFAQANTEAIQEQITRVLLERLIVNRPHPWGLLVTFIELIKEPVYKFWDHEFVHCAPEIEKLFESVARSCNVKANHQPQQLNLDGEIQELN